MRPLVDASVAKFRLTGAGVDSPLGRASCEAARLVAATRHMQPPDKDSGPPVPKSAKSLPCMTARSTNCSWTYRSSRGRRGL